MGELKKIWKLKGAEKRGEKCWRYYIFCVSTKLIVSTTDFPDSSYTLVRARQTTLGSVQLSMRTCAQSRA